MRRRVGSASRAARIVGVLSGCVPAVLSAGCGDGGVTGPEALSSFERAAVEEIAVDHVMDLLWVADGSHGGTYPHLAYAYGLPGVHGGILASITVDPSFEPGLFEPYCDASIIEGVRQCARVRRYEDGDYEIQVYYTIPPDRTPRAREEITHAGDAPVATVRHRPQPLRVWAYQVTPDGSVVSAASAQVDEGFTFTSAEGASVELGLEGVMTVDLGEPQEVHADLSLAGLPACAELGIAFDGVEHGDAGGEIRCGDRVWADLVFAAGEPLDVMWRD